MIQWVLPRVVSCAVLREFMASPAGKGEDGGSSDVSRSIEILQSRQVISGRRHPPSHAGRSFDVVKWKVGRVTLGAKSCENPRAGDVPQARKGVGLLEQLLCSGSAASPWIAASVCCDGSLAVIQPLWVHATSGDPAMNEREAPSQSSPSVSVHPRLAGDVVASVRTSFIDKEGSCLSAWASSPLMVIALFREWVGRRDTSLASLSQQAP